MSDLVQQWLLQLGLVSLPATKATCKEIQRLLLCSATNYTQFTDVIKHDPGFSLATLRAINSTHCKNRTPVVDIGRAIPLLGMTWLAETATTLPRINNQYSESQRKGITRCYSQAIHAAYYASYLATQQKSPHANEVFTMALLNNMGEMALWVNPSPIAQKIQALSDNGTPINEAIATCLDLTVNELNNALRQQWNLGNLDPLIYQPDHTNLERKICIDLAYRISQTSEQGWQHNTTIEVLKLAAEYLNATPDRFTSKIHSIAAEIARKTGALDLPCTAFNLAFIPQKIKQHPAATKTEHQQKHQPDPAPIPPNTQPPAPTATESRNQAGTKPARHLISRTMLDIQKLDGLSRVAFITLTRDRKQLATRTTLNSGEPSKIEQFRTNISQQDLFSLLLRKPQSIWMTPEKWAKHARLIPQQSYSLLESENFFAMSLFSKTRPIGLMYTDNGSNSAALDEAAFHNFKRLCQRISNELKQQS